MITTEDVRILLEAMELPVNVEILFTKSNQGMAANGESEQETYFTYKQYKALYEQIDGTEKGIPDFSEILRSFSLFISIFVKISTTLPRTRLSISGLA